MSLEPQANSSTANLSAQPIPGGWTLRSVELRGHTLEMLVPADPDQFLDFLTPSDNHPSWPDPYWAKLWPMSIELANQVLAAKWPANSRVVEIGCGCGIPGIAALACGMAVSFSDYIPLAMDLALANAARNGYSSGQALFLDWRDPPQLDFDIVLASEILYDRTLHEPILQTLRNILRPGGFAWLADPGRTAAEEFVPRALAEGWGVTLWDAAGNEHPRLRFNNFNLIELRKPRDWK